jgi:hypothetical protein|nr:MAG TPA: hypothetical protein [Caudoviricetes sp.]
MTKYTLHSRSYSEIEIHKDGEQVAIMKGKGSFFQRTRQWTARDNNGKTAAVGRSVYDCLKHYAATQGDNRIEQQPHIQGVRAVFTSLSKEEV